MNELLRVENLCKQYGRGAKAFMAISDINFSINKGEILGVIGESGSGKSTIAKIISGFESSTKGNIHFNGVKLSAQMKDRRNMQMIFQNPKTSLNPRQTISQSLTDAAKYSKKYQGKDISSALLEAMEQVRLPIDYLEKFPSQLSGGECQRVCIAKSILRKPELLICDEATSALDVSVQKEILELLREVQKKYNMSMLFISHDIAVVNYICSKILVIKQGKIEAELHSGQQLTACKNEYVQELLQANLFLFS